MVQYSPSINETLSSFSALQKKKKKKRKRKERKERRKGEEGGEVWINTQSINSTCYNIMNSESVMSENMITKITYHTIPLI